MDGPADLEPDTAARDIERVEKDMLDDFEMNLGLVLCLRKARNFRLQESKRCRIVNFIWSTPLQISPNYVIIRTSHNAANFRLLHRPTRGCCLRVLFFFLLSLSSNPQVSVCRAQSQLVAHSAACAAPRSHCSLRTVRCFVSPCLSNVHFESP